MKTILTEKELERLKVYLNDPRNGFTFKVGDFNIPLKLVYFDKYINLLESRNELLNKRSPGELEFKNWIKVEKLNILEQFPIPIEDYELWNKLSPPSYRNRRYFVIDFVIPEIGMNLEIDYTSTHDADYDKARDAYLLEKYNLITKRYVGFNKTRYRDLGIKINVLEDLRNNIDRFYPQWNLDFTDTILGYFEFKYKQEITTLKKILNRRLRVFKRGILPEKFKLILEEIGLHEQILPSKPYK